MLPGVCDRRYILARLGGPGLVFGPRFAALSPERQGRLRLK